MTWQYHQDETVVISRKVWGAFFRRILRKKSFLCIVVGEQGKGKSELVASTCECINKRFSSKDVIQRLKDVKVRMKEVKDVKEPFWVLNLDDFGRQLDPNRFNTAAALAMSWIFQTYRTLHQGVFLTVPNKELINKTFRSRLPNFLIEVKGYNVETGYTTFKFLRVQVNTRTGKVYYHNIFVTPRNDKLKTVQGKNDEQITSFHIARPSKKFLDWYLPFREGIAEDSLKEEQEEIEDLEEYINELRKDSSKKILTDKIKEKKRAEQLQEDIKKVEKKEHLLRIQKGKSAGQYDSVKIELELDCSRDYAKKVIRAIEMKS